MWQIVLIFRCGLVGKIHVTRVTAKETTCGDDDVISEGIDLETLVYFQIEKVPMKGDSDV